MENSLDQVHINFDTASLNTLNVALALVMFGIALEIKWSDFVQIIKRPQWVLLGVFSQFVCLPALTLFVGSSIETLSGTRFGYDLSSRLPWWQCI